MTQQDIIEAINSSPMNRGLNGADWFERPGNISINIDEDVFLFDYENEGIYQAHFLATEGGKATLRRSKQALRIMFDGDATMVFCLVPVARRDVSLMVRWIGFTYKQTVPTPYGVCDLYCVLKDYI